MQVTVTLDTSVVQAYETCREYVSHCVHTCGAPAKAVAADIDLSPSQLSRKLSQSPDDSMRLTVDDLEKIVQRGDTRPIAYLVAKYLCGGESKRIAELEAEIARIKQEFRK